MKTVIEAINTPSTFQFSGDIAELRIYATQPFVTSDGQLIGQGSTFLNQSWYLPIACEVQPENILYVPSFEIDSTTDGQPRLAKYIAALFDESGTYVGPMPTTHPSGFAIPPPSVIPNPTWGQLAIYNRLPPLLYPPTTYPTSDLMYEAIAAAISQQLLKASATDVGNTALSVDPTDPTFPIALGINDPLWLEVIAGLGGGVGFFFLTSYSDLATAVSEIGSTRATLLIEELALVADDLTIPDTMTLFFTNEGGIQPATGKTVTIEGPITAPPIKIFYNALNGQGTFRFTGNRRVVSFYPQWWGFVGDKDADDTLPLQACINQIPNSSTVLFPANTRGSISTMTIDQRAQLTFESEQLVAAFGDNRSAGLFYRDVGGNMFNMSAARGIAFRGLYLGNDNDVNGDVDRVLRWFGPPTTDINTQGVVQHCTINAQSNATVANPDWIGVAIGDSGDSQNCENFLIDDVDFAGTNGYAQQIAAHAGVLVMGSDNLEAVGADFDNTMIGKRLRCSWAAGILDTTIVAIVDPDNVTMADTAVSSEVDVRVHIGDGVGVAIKNATTNGKQHVFTRIRASFLETGIWFTNGSFTLQQMGGGFNNQDLRMDNVAEPCSADYIQTEQSLRVLTMGSTDGSLTLRYGRGANGNQLANGYYFSTDGQGQLIVEHSQVEFGQPADNGVVFGSTNSNVNSWLVRSYQNNWAPHNGDVNTLETMGFSRWKDLAEQDSPVSGLLISDGDLGIEDAPVSRYQWGAPLNGFEGLPSPRTANLPSFSVFTAQPHVAGATFVNEAVGYTNSTFASANGAVMKFVGFDSHSDNPSPNNFIRGGNYIGHRFTLPNGAGGGAVVSAIGLHVRGALANTEITTAYGVKVEDLAVVTGVTARRPFWQEGTTDLNGLKGLLAQGEGGVLSITSNTIVPTNNIHRIDNAGGLIKTITVPTDFFGGTIVLVAGSTPFTTDATDNIGRAVSPAAGQSVAFTWSVGASKWYPSL